MNYEFTKDQEMIRQAAKDFLETECPKEKVRHLREDAKAYDPEIWKKMVELGWMGVVLPEKYGGTEGEFFDLVILLEEMGKNILPSPFVATAAFSAMPILKFGTEEQKDEALSRIAAEGQIWTLAVNETEADYRATDVKLEAILSGDEYILNGTKLFVPYAAAAEKLLVVARTSRKANPAEGVTVFIVDRNSPGIEMELMPTAARDGRCEVRFHNVKVARANVLGGLDAGWEIMEDILTYAPVLKAAEMVGGAEAVLRITVKYASERVQFDKPIGSYQAVQHRLVNMLTEVEGLRHLVYEAAWKINAGEPSKFLSSMAKLKANNVYQQAGIDGVYLHGAIGFTEELDIGLYHIRSKAHEFDEGSSDLHQERIADELELARPPCLTLWS